MRMLCFCCCITLVTLSACSGSDSASPTATLIEQPITSVHYRLFKGDGSRASWQELIAASRDAQVVFLGELHSDPVAHHIELSILRDVSDESLALSLEMFESDVQHVIDEYLRGQITEEHFINDARAWDNYAEDYAPLIEYARENDIEVIAANPPRRYVNLVSREGVGGLDALSSSAKAFLPPLPYAVASPAYAQKFEALMAQNQSTQDVEDSNGPTKDVGNIERSLQAQSLWDAGMAYSIARYLETHPGARVLHVNGSFHSAEGLGIPEHLARYRPETDMLVITMMPDDRFPAFNRSTMLQAGDFVILTDPDLQPPTEE